MGVIRTHFSRNPRPPIVTNDRTSFTKAEKLFNVDHASLQAETFYDHFRKYIGAEALQRICNCRNGTRHAMVAAILLRYKTRLAITFCCSAIFSSGKTL